MKKCGFKLDEILKFFEDYNLGPWKLGKLLNIPGNVVREYLIEGKQVNDVTAAKIDTAVDIIGSQYTAQPKWKVGRNKTSEDWEDICGEWNRKMMEAINAAEKKEEAQEERAKDTIYLILLERDPGEFLSCEDPICRIGGLDNYSVENFVSRIRYKIGMY